MTIMKMSLHDINLSVCPYASRQLDRECDRAVSSTASNTDLWGEKLEFKVVW